MCQSFCCPHLEEAGGRMCVCMCVTVWVFEDKCMHMCMKGTEKAAVSRKNTLFGKSLPWPGLISSLISWVGVAHAHVCLCVNAQCWGFTDLWNGCAPEDRTALPPVAHSANLTDSLVQLSANKTAHWQGPNTWLLRNVICHEMTEEKLLTPLCA